MELRFRLVSYRLRRDAPHDMLAREGTLDGVSRCQTSVRQMPALFRQLGRDQLASATTQFR